MNKQQRSLLEKLKDQLEDIKSQIESEKEEEETKFSNMPESLQGGENGQKLETIAGYLGEVVDSLDTAISELDNAISE